MRTGRSSRTAPAPALLTSPKESWPEVDGRASNLAAALEMARQTLGSQPGTVILAAGGPISTKAGVVEELHAIAAAGESLQMISLGQVVPGGPVGVGPLVLPVSLWENSPALGKLTISATSAMETNIKIQIDGKHAGELNASLQPGEQTISIAIPPHAAGILRMGVTVEGGETVYATARVYSSPYALFITDTPDAATPVIKALQSAGINTATDDLSHLPRDTKGLEKYQVIFLHNLIAQDFSAQQVAVLKHFTAEMGRGLVFIGGRYSYTLGGYKNSALEPLLPVKMAPPPRQERKPVTFVLMIDASGSMDYPENGVVPLDLAREAALRVVETLQPSDVFGLVTYSDDAIWDVPVGEVGKGLVARKAMDAISSVRSYGGTQMYRALNSVLTALSKQPKTEHMQILLLSDGKSADGSPTLFRGLGYQAKQMGFSISTIALGDSADVRLMTDVATQTGGRTYKVGSPNDLPKIMVAETRAVISENVQMGEVNLVSPAGSHPLLAGLDLAQFPMLTGYNALTSRSDDGAEDILTSASFGDPILASWQYGLGRVMAWMGDVGEEWCTAWTSWPDAKAFWSQVTRYADPAPAQESSEFRATSSETRSLIELHLRDDAGTPLNPVKVELRIESSDPASPQSILLAQVGPGDYHIDLPRLLDGAYAGEIRGALGAGEEEIRLPVGFCVNPPLEEAESESGGGQLAAWIQQLGGKKIAWSDLARAEVQSQPVSVLSNNFGMILWIAIIVYWPVEILLRRRWLPWK